ncbi:MAG: hypothetical protein Q4B35_06400 [Slackia sp.]|nr:hypothetical protein [Slackia sp.]
MSAKGITNTWQGTGVVFEGVPAGKAVVTGARGHVGGIVTTGRAVGANENAHWSKQLGKPARVVPEAALGDATAVDIDKGGTVGFLLKPGDTTFAPHAVWDDSAASMPALIPEI